jgi:lipopolysaccharide biosynthesis regulator YciM
MELQNSVLFSLLMLALLLISWLLGYYARFKKPAERKLAPDMDYFVGLNYLLNDEPDDAIDVFIDALEVNSSTFDTHLALGKLLKRRGKVDRSIEHFQALIAAQKFNSRQVGEIKIQLVRSYIAAGLLDRAESLLDELKQFNVSFRLDALNLSVMLYQIEKDWHKALDAASELLKLIPSSQRHELQMQVSHFHCEVAETDLKRNSSAAARDELKKALNLFKGNIRVYMLLARIEFHSGNPNEAVAALQKALQIDPVFFGDIYPELRKYLISTGRDEQNLILPELEEELGEDSSYLVERGLQKLKYEGAEAALRYFLVSLQLAPSLVLLERTMRLAATSDKMQEEVLDAGLTVLNRYLDNKPRYRCENCGFDLKNLHWACPGCNCWGVVKPVSNLISVNAEFQRDEHEH